MTDEEKFVFDLEGYFVLKNVLNEDELKEMNAVADEAMGQGGGRGGRVCQWAPQFTNLMDHPRILPYLLDLLGPKFRLDHDYCIFMRKGDTGGGLHGGTDGGAHMGEADHWYKYREGVMRNGLSVFTFFLTPARRRRRRLRMHTRQPQKQLLPRDTGRSAGVQTQAELCRSAGGGSGRRALFHRGACAWHDALDGRPSAARPAV